MHRLYIEQALSENQLMTLVESQSHYLIKVMRLRQGDEILVFNGVDGEWKARITMVSKKSVMVQALTQTRPQAKPSDLWLLFSPLKPKRQEFLVEKATELGVSCLCPIRCERTSIPKVNSEKMKAHVIEASEQCGRLTIPEIKPLTSLKETLANWPQDRLLLFGDETLTSPSLSKIKLDPEQSTAFLVGPEGGFTAQEFDLLRAHGTGVTLNANILRAETAGLVGLAWLMRHHGINQ